MLRCTVVFKFKKLREENKTWTLCAIVWRLLNGHTRKKSTFSSLFLSANTLDKRLLISLRKKRFWFFTWGVRVLQLWKWAFTDMGHFYKLKCVGLLLGAFSVFCCGGSSVKWLVENLILMWAEVGWLCWCELGRGDTSKQVKFHCWIIGIGLTLTQHLRL